MNRRGCFCIEGDTTDCKVFTRTIGIPCHTVNKVVADGWGGHKFERVISIGEYVDRIIFISIASRLFACCQIVYAAISKPCDRKSTLLIWCYGRINLQWCRCVDTMCSCCAICLINLTVNNAAIYFLGKIYTTGRSSSSRPLSHTRIEYVAVSSIGRKAIDIRDCAIGIKRSTLFKVVFITCSKCKTCVGAF